MVRSAERDPGIEGRLEESRDEPRLELKFEGQVYEVSRVSSEAIRQASALVAVALASLAAAVLVGCGSDPTGTAGGAAAAAAKPDPAESSRPRPVDKPKPKPAVLPVAQKGNPILWVRKGESTMLRYSPGGKPIESLRPRTEYGSPTVFSVDHVEGKWAAVPTPLLPNGQLGWVKLDPDHLGSGFTNISVDVDLSDRVAVLRRGKRVIDRFAVTVGAPGVETPTGRFAVTDTFRGDLNDASYGCCAVALTSHQPHLPSGWLGGNRIAIHGTYGPLGEALSHGCVRAANEDASLLVKTVSLGTPVKISP